MNVKLKFSEGATFKPNRMQRHAQNTGPYQCAFCNRKIKYRRNLVRHLHYHQNEKLELPLKVPKPSQDKNVFTCSVCGATFIKKCNHTTHAKRFHKFKELPFRNQSIERQKYSNLEMRNDDEWLADEVKIDVGAANENPETSTSECVGCGLQFTGQEMIHHIKSLHAVAAATPCAVTYNDKFKRADEIDYNSRAIDTFDGDSTHRKFSYSICSIS